jgi:FtsH-binding integral membrane protein
MREDQIIDYSSNVVVDADAVRRFTAHVFSWMVGGLAITAAIAYYFASSGAFEMLFNEGGRTMLGWVVALSPLAFILVMNFAFERFSATGIALLFMLFSATMGASLSYVFLMFSLSSLTTVFGITAGTFAIMAVVGYTTKTDLTRFGSLLMMALIGIIIAMVVNWFMQSSQLDYIISIIGVLIFTGLIAYDTQKIKNMGAQVGLASDQGRKLAIMGATSLYLDFINLFLFLLRLLGRRD